MGSAGTATNVNDFYMRFHFLAARLSVALLALSLFSCQNQPASNSTKVAGVEIPEILPEDTSAKGSSEATLITTNYNKAIAELRKNSDNPKPFLDLASTFIQQGRISSNGAYYSNAALQMIDQVLNGETATKDQRFYAYSLKSAVMLHLQRYPEAREAAQQGLNISQYNAGIWGCLVDAQVELGHYDSAIVACDRMVRLRPDLRSYARVSYLREIMGENQPAIEAMKMAVQSGVAGLESTEWARAQLGDLYFNTGHKDSATLQYRYALFYRPGYAPAAMGMAHVFTAEKNLDSAIRYAELAVQAMPESSYQDYLADLLEWNGNPSKAKQIRAEALQTLTNEAASESKYDLAKYNRTREFALAYLAARDFSQAYRYAKADFGVRPANIDANALMAWVCYKLGKVNEAHGYADKAMSTHKKNAVLLYQCGTIFTAAGNATQGEMLKKEALSLMPYLDLRQFQ